MFIAALFTRAKICKQPTSPLMDVLIKKMWYVYNGTLAGYKKNNDSKPYEMTWMELEGIMGSEISQKENKCHINSFTCGI